MTPAIRATPGQDKIRGLPSSQKECVQLKCYTSTCICVHLHIETRKLLILTKTECLNDASDYKGGLIINKCVYLDPA